MLITSLLQETSTLRVGKLQDGIENIDDISVRSSRDGVVNNIGHQFQLQYLIGERCRPPDHSVLSLLFVISSVPEVEQQYDVSLNKMYEANDEQIQTDSNCILQRRYKLNNFPVDFQNNEIWSNALVEIISFLQTFNDTQQEIDIIYEKLCTTFYKEMATYLFPIKTTTGSKVKCKYYKPYWDEELSILWEKAIYNEKVFRKYKGSIRKKQDISLQYQISLRSFDKPLRKKERLYRKKNAEKIESLNNVNQKRVKLIN